MLFLEPLLILLLSYSPSPYMSHFFVFEHLYSSAINSFSGTISSH